MTLTSRMRIAGRMIPMLLLFAILGLPGLRADGTPKQDSSKKLLTRTYRVGAWFLSTDPKWLATAKGKQPLDVRTDLNAKGIVFPPGSSATYTPATRRLVLVNNRDQIELF